MLLGSTALGLGSVLASYLMTRGYRPKLTPEEKILRSMVDTIVPADSTPGAVDAGIDILLGKAMRSQRNLSPRVERVSAVIDKTALAENRRGFTELDLGQREAILNKIISARNSPLIRGDLLSIRQFVLTKFYSSNKGRESINYVLPAHYPSY